MSPVPPRNKRERERAKQEKRKEKAARRAEAKARRANGRPSAPGEDPDIAGIVPGPQRSPWADSMPPGEADEES